MLSLWYEKVGGHLIHFIQISAKSGWGCAHCAHPASTPLKTNQAQKTKRQEVSKLLSSVATSRNAGILTLI